MNGKSYRHWFLHLSLLVILLGALAPAHALSPIRRIGYGRMQCATIAPDGTKVLTGGDLGAFLLDAKTGAVLREYLGHTMSVVALAFSGDGERFLTGSNDGTARMWDTATGAVLRTFKGHSGRVLAVAFSPDGTRALTGGDDDTARLWDTATGATLLTLRGHTSDVVSVAISPDGSELLTGSYDKSARLWNASTGALLRTYTGHLDKVNSVAFSPDGGKLLTGSQDATAQAWNKATGEQLVNFYGHRAAVKAASFSPDGKTVLTASSDYCLCLWDTVTGNLIRSLTGHLNSVSGASFEASGAQILSWSLYDQTARLWSSATGNPGFVFYNHSLKINSVALSPDQSLALTGGDDNILRLWDANTGQLIRATVGQPSPFYFVTFTQDQSQALAVSNSNYHYQWDLNGNFDVSIFFLNANFTTSYLLTGMVANDHNTFLTAAYFEHPTVVDLANANVLFSIADISTIHSLAISPDGTQALIGYRTNSLGLWNIPQKNMMRNFPGHPVAVDFVGFMDHGAKIFSKDISGGGRIWDAATGKPLKTFSALSTTPPYALSPDGSRLLMNNVIMDTWTATPLQTLNYPDLSINAVSFSSDGQTMVTGDTRGYALLWAMPGPNAADQSWGRYQ